jgi:hypothetical protein
MNEIMNYFFNIIRKLQILEKTAHATSYRNYETYNIKNPILEPLLLLNVNYFNKFCVIWRNSYEFTFNLNSVVDSAAEQTPHC